MAGDNSARPINELTGIKKRSSVLVRGMSHMELAIANGSIPPSYTVAQYVEWAKGPRGFSTFELWQQQPGNENMTLEDFFDWLGFVEASQEAAIMAAIAAAQADTEADKTAAAASAALAEAWASQIPGAVSGGLYSARKYATDAEAAKTAAEAAAASMVGGSLSQGAIFGMQFSNNAVTPASKVDCSVGQGRSVDNQTDIVFSAPVTIDLNTVGLLGKDAATALAFGQSWHIHAIKRTDTNVSSAIASLSPNAPTLPVPYTKSRRIFTLPALGYDNVAPAAPGGTSIPPFVHKRNRVSLKRRTYDYVNQTGGNAAVLRTFGVLPLGISVEAEIFAQANSDGTTSFLRLSDPDEGVPYAYGQSDQYGQIRLSGSELYIAQMLRVETNAARQVYVFPSYSAITWAAGVKSWIDARDQF